MRTDKATSVLEGKYDNANEEKKNNKKSNFTERKYDDLNELYVNAKRKENQ